MTELRTRQGWSYSYVARKVGCSPSYMNDIEHGKQNPTFQVLRAIADVHGIKLSRLIAMGERRHERGAGKRATSKANAVAPAKKPR